MPKSSHKLAHLFARLAVNGALGFDDPLIFVHSVPCKSLKVKVLVQTETLFLDQRVLSISTGNNLVNKTKNLSEYIASLPLPPKQKKSSSPLTPPA